MTAVTQLERPASELSVRERIYKAVRAAGRGINMGRSSSAILGPETQGNAQLIMKRLFQAYAPLAYQLPWEILDYVELLATYNPDYSQAVENIKMLSNTGHTLMIDASSELQRSRTKALLEEQSRLIQESHGGIDGVIDKLLNQAATFGACSGEWILSEDLTRVVDFADISPKKIRFFWDEDAQRYLPYQKVNSQQAREAEKQGQKVINDCVQLNELTFRYFAFNAAPGSPYGTPPFIAALQNIAIQKDIVHNMAQIVKKIGLLGMVDLSVEKLDPLQGEGDAEYETRAGAYLDAYVNVAEEMVRDGGMVHFDDVKATMMQLGGNAAGATNIHKQNEEQVFSGLKMMPSLAGRSFSTTETYAGVAYEITLRNTLKYQRAIKRMIESGYWLMATMGGLTPDSIRLVFNSNRSLNRNQEAAAERLEIMNAFTKWVMGIIDQVGAAQELGYSDPKTPMEEPPEALISIGSAHGISENPNPDDFAEADTRHAKLREVEDDEESEREEDE